MILLILSVLSSLSSLSCFQNHSNNVHQLYDFPLYCLVMIGDSHLVSFSFLFPSSLCFVHFFLYENDSLSCDMLQRKHIQVFRPQTSHSVPSVPLFFLFFFFLFPFFLFLFSSFSFSFVQLEKKKKDHFFSSLAVLVPDQSQDGLENSGRHAEDSLEHLLFVFIFQKVFAFVLLFSLTVLKVKEWPPSTWSHSPAIWQQCFFPLPLLFFLDYSLLDFSNFCPSGSGDKRCWVFLVVCGIDGFSDFDSVCISFIILVLYFSWGFVTPHC